MTNRRSFLLLMMTSLAGGFAVAGPAPAFAKDDGKGGGDDGGGDDGGGDDGGDKDDDRIRDAVKRGEAESLGKILPVVRRKYPGKVVRIRLTGSGSRRTYRIRVIDRDNQLFEVRVNAQSGRIMGISSL